jgi:RecA/RadA recombinase
MTINIIGDAPTVRRLETGLYTFDRAFENKKGDIGFPLGIGVGIHGLTHCGKSTIVYGLSGLIASAQEKSIALVDLEGFDPIFLSTVLENAGYSGDVQNIQEKTDEKMLNKLVSFMKDDDYCVGILDSVAAISPITEQKGSVGEANMGARAFRMAQLTRKMLPILRNSDLHTLFMVNHMYPKIGGFGYTIPGGEVQKFLASIIIRVKRVYYKDKYAEYPDGSYIIEGKVIKNRWGFKDRTFWLFVLAGRGIHIGLTNLYESHRLYPKVVTIERNIVKIGDESFGNLAKIVRKAHEGETEIFEPFIKVLKDNENEDNI